MMAFSMRKIAGFIALFHVTSVVATVYPCESCGSPNLSPAPEAASPGLQPLSPADSPETNMAPKDGVFDVTEHGAVADGGIESSSVCTS